MEAMVLLLRHCDEGTQEQRKFTQPYPFIKDLNTPESMPTGDRAGPERFFQSAEEALNPDTRHRSQKKYILTKFGFMIDVPHIIGAVEEAARTVARLRAIQAKWNSEGNREQVANEPWPLVTPGFRGDTTYAVDPTALRDYETLLSIALEIMYDKSSVTEYVCQGGPQRMLRKWGILQSYNPATEDLFSNFLGFSLALEHIKKNPDASTSDSLLPEIILEKVTNTYGVRDCQGLGDRALPAGLYHHIPVIVDWDGDAPPHIPLPSSTITPATEGSRRERVALAATNARRVALGI